MSDQRVIAKAIKIESFQEGKVLQVKKGDILNGYFFEWPVVGKSFVIYTCSPEKVEQLLAERQAARDTKDFQKSDELRKQIEDLGYEVKDTISGQQTKKL
jgi:cysteinyl-tRNA synthetase